MSSLIVSRKDCLTTYVACNFCVLSANNTLVGTKQKGTQLVALSMEAEGLPIKEIHVATLNIKKQAKKVPETMLWVYRTGEKFGFSEKGEGRWGKEDGDEEKEELKRGRRK